MLKNAQTSMNEKTIAVYAGSFDPITNGHADVIKRAAGLFDKVVVVVGVNSKKTTLFDEKERVETARIVLADVENVEVASNRGLTVEFAQSIGAKVLIRGVRAVSDFDFEFQIALMNRKIAPELTTIFLTPDEKYTYLNSSIIRELARHGQCVDEFVHPETARRLREKFILG